MTKCNNLRYKAKIDGNEDYGRICIENDFPGLAFLRSDREDGHIATWHCDDSTIEGICGRKVTDFELVPRDPETYKDWQVGDIIWDSHESGDNGRIIFRSGDFVAADIDGCRCYTCEEVFDDGYRLVLTDIEKQIIEESKNASKPYGFKKGEPVMVRDNDKEIWKLRAYIESIEDYQYTYRVKTDGHDSEYRYCIPYNERTMHLLGTAEDYKEGE